MRHEDTPITEKRASTIAPAQDARGCRNRMRGGRIASGSVTIKIAVETTTKKKEEECLKNGERDGFLSFASLLPCLVSSVRPSFLPSFLAERRKVKANLACEG